MLFYYILFYYSILYYIIIFVIILYVWVNYNDFTVLPKPGMMVIALCQVWMDHLV